MLCNTFLQNTVVLLLLVSLCIGWVVLLVLAGTTHAFIVSCASVLLILAGFSHVWMLTGWSVIGLARMSGLFSMCFSIFSTRQIQTCSHASGWFKRMSKSVWALLRPGLGSGTLTITHSIGQSKFHGHPRYKAPYGRGCTVTLQTRGTARGRMEKWGHHCNQSTIGSMLLFQFHNFLPWVSFSLGANVMLKIDPVSPSASLPYEATVCENMSKVLLNKS